MTSDHKRINVGEQIAQASVSLIELARRNQKTSQVIELHDVKLEGQPLGSWSITVQKMEDE